MVAPFSKFYDKTGVDCCLKDTLKAYFKQVIFICFEFTPMLLFDVLDGWMFFPGSITGINRLISKGQTFT